jgi:uncharacterized membrane protein YeaQ/YmgE (transglycosylase-associated protein family)
VDAEKEEGMIGMDLHEFVVLLILSFVASMVVHYLPRYRHLEGLDGFLSKWLAGWIGAWIGQPVLGHWWFRVQGVWVIPALLAAFAGAFAVAAIWKAQARTTRAKTA